jgi:aspartate aminotransferase
MPDKELVMASVLGAQLNGGWAFPNALMQHALGDLEGLSIDLKHLQSKRDRMVEGLKQAGYRLEAPEGTFYLLVKCPTPDEGRFVDALAARDVFVLPGLLADAPGYFRISLTANDEMIDRALPIFAELAEE